jgi:hypothetical protein
MIKYHFQKLFTDILFTIARIMPKSVVLYCAIYVMSYSTSGKYSNTVVPELSGMDAIKRFSNDYNIN